MSAGGAHEQLTFHGTCGHIEARTEPHHDGEIHELACTLPTHDDTIPHRLEWQPTPRSHIETVKIARGLL